MAFFIFLTPFTKAPNVVRFETLAGIEEGKCTVSLCAVWHHQLLWCAPLDSSPLYSFQNISESPKMSEVLQAASCPAFSCWLFQDPRRLAEVAHWAEWRVAGVAGVARGVSCNTVQTCATKIYKAPSNDRSWLSDSWLVNESWWQNLEVKFQGGENSVSILQKVVRLSGCFQTEAGDCIVHHSDKFNQF